MLVTSAHSNILIGDISMDIYSISAKLNLIFDIESSNISNELFQDTSGSSPTWGGMSGQSNYWLQGVPSWNKGISPSKETRKKISETNKIKGINWNSNGATEAARQYHLGRKQTEDHICKRTSQRCRRVEVDGVEYESLKQAAETLGVNITAISGRLVRGKSARYL